MTPLVFSENCPFGGPEIFIPNHRSFDRDMLGNREGVGDLTSVTEVHVTARALLQHFVDASQLHIVYQPIVDMGDGTPFGYEALLRCNDPRYRTPADLFNRALASRQVGALGRVIRQLAVSTAPDLPLFLNVHPEELDDGWLLRSDDPIFQHRTDVFLELTEAAPLTGFDRSHALLRTVREHPRVHLVIDDLGAGFSNLRCLADLDPVLIKLDRSLISGLPSSARQQRLLRGVVRLCEDLGARVVAEGIETVDEFLAARDAGAHYGQGYLMARPAFPRPGVFWRP